MKDSTPTPEDLKAEAMTKASNRLESFLDDLIYVDAQNRTEIDKMEKKYNCLISCSVEKHNALQYTYYYEIDFGEKLDLYFVEIENGISNGTQIVHSEWGESTKTSFKTVEVLKDIVVDRNLCKSDFHYRKCQAVLQQKKGVLLKYHRENAYDNYVTGGNSRLKINDKLAYELTEFLDYVYEEVEVQRSFV